MNRSFADVGAFTTGRNNSGGGGGVWAGEVNLTAGDRPLRVRSPRSTITCWPFWACSPLTAGFSRREKRTQWPRRPGLGGPPLAVLSHELWQTAFGGQALIGQTLSVDGRPHDVIGIMPPGVDLMDSRPEIWLPIGVHPAVRRIRTSHPLNVVGRLKDGVTPEAARLELNAFLENWADRAGAKGHVPTRSPSRPEDHLLQLEPLQDAIVGDASRAIWLLQAGVGLVLLIGCANLANLALARVESRRREFAVRTALGASRGRLLRQTMTEGVLLSAAGGVLGVLVANAGVRALLLAYPASLPRTSDVAIDVPVLLFALVVSIATGFLFGLTPIALRRARDLVPAIREGHDRGATGGRRHVRRILVVAEVALAMMLVTCAALLLRTVYNLTRVDAGFDRSRLVTFSMTLPRSTKYRRVARRFIRGCSTRSGPFRAFRPRRPCPITDRPLRPAAVDPCRERRRDRPGDRVRRLLPVRDVRLLRHDGHSDRRRPRVQSHRRGLARPGRHRQRNAGEQALDGPQSGGQRLRPNLAGTLGTMENPWHTVIGVAKDGREGGVDRERRHGALSLRRSGWTADRRHRASMGPDRAAHDARGAADRAAAGVTRRNAPSRPCVRPIPRSRSCGCARWTRCFGNRSGTRDSYSTLLSAFGCRGASSRRRRHLWRPVLHGHGTPARSGHPDGARRGGESGVLALVFREGLRLTAVGLGDRTRGRDAPEPADRVPAVRRAGRRPTA